MSISKEEVGAIRAATPGPWHLPVSSVIVGADSTRICDIAAHQDSAVKDANAAFIVRACNAHDDLVAALRAIHLEATTDIAGLSRAELDNLRATVAAISERVLARVQS